ncbi:unnamed protein product [Adineta steineri]|uniref:Uncharacterized protein n=1 Tax=Adineta steineri TaxID=433720 RepID=A0A814WPU8_9BILA|nr:unnamed protein product [Adineta steineri]CAF4043329.1 unnamed protein product [Adineta steineri]
MDFDLEQTIDFVEDRNFKRSLKYSEKQKKKRKLYFEQPSNNNELPDVISSFPLHIDIKPSPTKNTEDNYFLKKQIIENLDHMNQIESINAYDDDNDDEVIDYPSDDSKYCIDHDIHPENLLHYYTDISTNEFCSSLLNLLRKSNTCKLHANRLLSFISSILPAPNNVPKKMEDLLKQLEIANNTFKKYLFCTICKEYLSFENKFCSKCSPNDPKRFAFVYDMNIEESIKNIHIRLERDIKEYQNQLRLMDDQDLTNDIGFNNLYQQLLRDNSNDNFITFLLHLDDIRLSKSTKMKMWLFSGSIIELRPQLRGQRIMINENYRINIKFLSITGDSPALSKILNFNGHNGYYCCHFCYIRGIHTDKKKRQYFYEQKVFLRDIQKYEKYSQEAEELKEIVYGHKGVSILREVLDVRLPHAHYYSIDSYLHGKISQPKYELISQSIDSITDINLNDYTIILQYHKKTCNCSDPLNCISIHRRCLIRNHMFHSFIYNKKGKSNSYFVSYVKSENAQVKHFGKIILFFSFMNNNYALVQRHVQSEKFSGLFKQSAYFFLLEKVVDKFFWLVSKEPANLFDIVPINQVIKHCITFQFQQQLIVTEISAYHEHD